jgi:hypothetical protein
MKSLPKITDIREIIDTLSLMTPEDRKKAMVDIYSYDSTCIKKVFDGAGKLVSVKYIDPNLILPY